MLNLYRQTPLEDMIEAMYKEKGIYQLSDLEIENVATKLNIKIVYMAGAPDRAIWTDRKAAIFLNPKRPNAKLREIFFHELCHPIRHYGSQHSMSNDAFRELQEIQANHFQLYAAMPFFILNKIKLPIGESTINTMADLFNLPHDFVMKRLEQIKRRIDQSKGIDNFTYQESGPIHNWRDIPSKEVPEHAKTIVDLALQRKQVYRG
ncbi:ImmA/IrrE family metallo-endopeptidase [Bacillus infantis]|uniref:ImmA/IrrE family metallo-endopeptidase n=1 Tax=Bacillus infantis TaxID=324767 RepID=UPI00344F4F48